MWKILQEMGIPDHLTCLLKNLYADQEATVRFRHGTTDWFKIGKGEWEGYTLSPRYLTSMQSIVCEMPSWMTHKLESRLPGEISTTSDVQMMPFNGRKWRGIKEHFDEGERGEGKSWLKNQHSKMKIIASSPITSWQIDGETMKTVIDFILGGS